MKRRIQHNRVTKETDIALDLAIDGTGEFQVETGIPFFDHMLASFSKHGFFDLVIKGKGDREVDAHHVVEDIGITLGEALRKAIGEGRGIKRFGNSQIPMTETLTSVTVDISNRPHFVYNVKLPRGRVGDFDADLGQEFLRAFSLAAGFDLHVNVWYGKNVHHILESVFKGLGKALDEATTVDPRVKGVLSTKGSL